MWISLPGFYLFFIRHVSHLIVGLSSSVIADLWISSENVVEDAREGSLKLRFQVAAQTTSQRTHGCILPKRSVHRLDLVSLSKNIPRVSAKGSKRNGIDLEAQRWPSPQSWRNADAFGENNNRSHQKTRLLPLKRILVPSQSKTSHHNWTYMTK